MTDTRRPRAKGKWWRAAEPIPARPLALDNFHGAAGEPAGFSPPEARAKPATGVAQSAALPIDPAARHPADPGYVTAPSAGENVPGLTAAPPEPRDVASLGIDPADIAAPSTRAASSSWTTGSGQSLRRRLRRSAFRTGQERGPAKFRRGLAAAGLAGAIVFAGVTGFGQRINAAQPFGLQFDALLAKSGFAINEVAVSGHQQTLESEIFRALGPLDRTLLRLDVAAARQRIEALAWIESAQISRVLPDKLLIAVKERRAFAVWEDGGQAALVDKAGRVLGPAGRSRPQGLWTIAGRGAPEAAPGLIAALMQHEIIAGKVAVARRIGGRRWNLELSNGTLVRLGAEHEGRDIARLARLERSSALTQTGPSMIDLRQADRVAVGPLPPPPSTAAIDGNHAEPVRSPAEPL